MLVSGQPNHKYLLLLCMNDTNRNNETPWGRKRHTFTTIDGFVPSLSFLASTLWNGESAFDDIYVLLLQNGAIKEEPQNPSLEIAPLYVTLNLVWVFGILPYSSDLRVSSSFQLLANHMPLKICQYNATIVSNNKPTKNPSLCGMNWATNRLVLTITELSDSPVIAEGIYFCSACNFF